MELTIALVIVGSLVLIFNLHRARNFKAYDRLARLLRENHNIARVDLTGATEYTHCYSYEWIMMRVTHRKSGRISRTIQQALSSNTLSMGMFLAFLIGIAGMAIGFLFVASVIITGTTLVVIVIGIVLAIGPGNPRFSEELLSELLSQDPSVLNHEDYAYVVLAKRSIVNWVRVSSLMGIVFLVAAPFGESLPSALALAVSSFATFFLIEPALFLFQFSTVFAVIYIFVVPTFLLVIIPKAIYQRIRDESEPSEPIR